VGKEAKAITAHRIILAVASPVFDAMLQPRSFDGKEEDVKLPIEVKLENENADVFPELLKCIYGDTVKIDLTIINEYMRVAAKYEIEKLADLCSDALGNDVSVENAFELFQIITNLHSDSAAIMEFLSENSDALLESDSFLNMKRETLKVLLKQDLFGVEEFPLFKAVQNWGAAEAKRQGHDNVKKALGDVLNLIRFPVFTTSEVASIASSGFVDQSEMVSLFSYSSMTDESAKKKVKMPWDTKPREGAAFMKGSKILNNKQKKTFLKFFDTQKKIKFGLLWQGSKDGFDGTTFHNKCDNKGPTITVVKSGQYIFGGYNNDNWTQSGSYTTSGAWLYSLQNPSNNPIKLNMTSSNYGAYGYSNYGPTWGGGHDLHISNSMRSSGCYSNPYSYSIASGYSGSYANTTLAGSYNFIVDEIEVWTVTLQSS